MYISDSPLLRKQNRENYILERLNTKQPTHDSYYC